MRQLLLIALVYLLIASCNDDKPKVIDTPTSGNITVSCDESLRPIAEAEKDVFESLYPNAHINLVFTSEQHAIDLVLKDSARMAFVTRKMNADEENQLKEQKISRSRSIKIAYDAIAFILNKSNKTLCSVNNSALRHANSDTFC
jgi:phosphate transport system substrate-binding protein